MSTSRSEPRYLVSYRFGMNLDDVAFAVQAEAFGPDGQGAQEGDALDDIVAGEIRVLVDDIAAVGVLVGGAPALDDLQRRPARAVEVVVEEREGQCLPLPRGFQI